MIDKKKKRKYKMLLGILFCMFLLIPGITGLYLNDLEDVNTDSAISCNLLHYNGTSWTNYDLFNQSITWYKPNIFLDIITAKSYYGDGGNLTNISGVTIPSYLTSKGHPHNQDLNTTSDVNFDNITAIGNITINGFSPYHKLLFGDFPTQYGTLFINSALRELDIFGNNNIERIGLHCGSMSGSPILPDFILNSDGITTIPRQSATRVRLLNTQIIPSGIFTKMYLTVNDYDLNSDWIDSTYRFVCPVAGLYQISYALDMDALPDRTLFTGAIYKNGVVSGGYVLTSISSALVSSCSISGSDILYLMVNDYIELYVNQNSGSNKNMLAVTFSNYLAICKIA